MKKKLKPVEARLILERLDAETLLAFSQFEASSQFELFQNFLKRYAETKRNQIIDLPTVNERVLANELAIRKGSIYTVGVIAEVIQGAQKELDKREKK